MASYAVQQGILGAIIGGLEVKFSMATEQRMMAAEQAKQERLMQLRQQYELAAEGRANAEWERRFEMEGDQARENFELEKQAQRDMFGIKTDAEREQMQYGHQLDMTELERRSELERQQTQFEEDLLRDRPPGPGDVEGLYGTDGQWYPVGTGLPAGVEPVTGFGATNLGRRGTSDSASPLSRRGATSGRATEVAPMPGARKAPDGKWYVQQNGQWFQVGP